MLRSSLYNLATIVCTFRSLPDLKSNGNVSVGQHFMMNRVLDKFKYEWSNLHKEFKTTYPLKIHIMIDHVNDYVEMVGGGLNKRGTEAAHKLFMERMDKSGYWTRKVGTEKEGEGLYRVVVHVNAYNL